MGIESVKELCDSLTLTWPFLANTIFLLLISSISISGNVFVFFILHRSRSFHFNVRLLLKNFLFCATLISLYSTCKSVYNFYVWRNGFVIMSQFLCGIIETQMLIVVMCMILSIAAIGLERVINTIWKSKRKDPDRPSVLAYMTLASCWSVSIAVAAPLMVNGFLGKASSKPICYCQGVYAAPISFSYLICPSFVLVEGVIIICYLFLYKHSRSTYLDFTINTTQHSLAQRYQMLSNVRATVLLMPTILIHGTTYFILAAFASYLGITNDEEDETAPSIIYMLLMVDIPIFEAAAHPFLLLARDEYLLKSAAHYLPILNRFAGEGNQTEKAANVQQCGSVKKNANALSILSASNRVTDAVVEFRIKPEQHEDILNCIWQTKKNRFT